MLQKEVTMKKLLLITLLATVPAMAHAAMSVDQTTNPAILRNNGYSAQTVDAVSVASSAAVMVSVDLVSSVDVFSVTVSETVVVSDALLPAARSELPQAVKASIIRQTTSIIPIFNVLVFLMVCSPS
jgi:hypothetical protein